jgi:uncharacterized protein (TIGR02231 family)
MEKGDAGTPQPADAAAEYLQTVQKELPFSFEYGVPQPVDIPSRDAASLLPIRTKKLAGDFFHYAVPRKTALSFLVCAARADQELLSGQLNVYFGGRYIGETRLTEKKPGAPFYLNLGADRAVKVKREKLKDKVKETYFGRLQRDTVLREFEYRITAENLKREAVRLKIEDCLPVSKTDKIEVKEIHLTPAPDERNRLDKEGVMLWNLGLSPGEKAEIHIGFSVAYPAESPPSNL